MKLRCPSQTFFSKVILAVRYLWEKVGFVLFCFPFQQGSAFFTCQATQDSEISILLPKSPKDFDPIAAQTMANKHVKNTDEVILFLKLGPREHDW